MTDEPIDEKGRDALAAEVALRLLSEAEEREASDQAAGEQASANDVARWRGRLSGLFDEVEEIAPPAQLWDRIAAATGARSAANDNVAALRQRLKVWRGAASAMTAIAAALAIVLVVQPRGTIVPAPPMAEGKRAPMVAMLGNDEKDMKVVASWDPVGRQLILAVAGTMPKDPGHAHELWVIPAGGKPKSLGTMPAGKQMHMQLADAIAELMRQGATIAISAEPMGGSPTGAPTGPVLVSGSLSQA